MARHHKLIYLSVVAILVNNINASEIIDFSQSPSVTQGSSGESIFCEANQKIDSCGWKKIGNDDFKCVVSREEVCQQAEGISGSVQGSVCTLNFDREIHYDDRGSYECIAIFLDEDKARATVDLDVWVRAQAQFEDLFGGSEHEVQVKIHTLSRFCPDFIQTCHDLSRPGLVVC